VRAGTIRWKEAGETNTVHITVNLQPEQPYVEFDYLFGREHRRCRVQFTRIPSNLGRGHIYRFVCPVTQRRCTMLYFIHGYFMHRSAVEGMYLIQTQSRLHREFHKIVKKQIKLEQNATALQQKHFRTHYKGKPTKRYLRLTK
jgi:hypothetical protein